MGHSAEKVARPAVTDHACPACGAKPGEPCYVPIQGVDTSGWEHDARILAPIIADLRTHDIPPAETEGGA